jgi:hypothetical protein
MAGKKARCGGCGGVMAIPSRPPDLNPLDEDEFEYALQAQRRQPALAQPPSASAQQPAPSSAADYLAKARRELGSRQTGDNLPAPVKMATYGLAIPGALSCVLAILCVLMVLTGDTDRFGRVLGLLIAPAHLFVGIGAITVAMLLQQRVAIARPIGFVIAVLLLCGSPLHFVCGMIALVGLSSSETRDFVAQR